MKKSYEKLFKRLSQKLYQQLFQRLFQGLFQRLFQGLFQRLFQGLFQRPVQKFIFASSIFIMLSVTGCVMPIIDGNISFAGDGIVGTGEIISQTTVPGSFTGINIGRSFMVIYRHSNTPSVRVEMHENLFEYLEILLRGDILYIDTSENFRMDFNEDFNEDYNEDFNEELSVDSGVYLNEESLNRDSLPRIYIYAPYLERINFHGFVNATGWDTIYAEDLSINVSGAGNLSIPLEVRDIRVNASGAGNFNLTGTADTVDILASGAVNFSSENLQARDVSLDVSGAVNARVYASENLNARASGAANVRYFGRPDTVNSEVSALGSVRQAEES